MPGIHFHEVRARVSMLQVLELLGFVARAASGDELRGACPMHGSTSRRSRSLSANVKKQVYRCFRCGSAGNHLELYAAATHQSLYAAAVDLCQRVGCAVPWINVPGAGGPIRGTVANLDRPATRTGPVLTRESGPLSNRDQHNPFR